MLYSAGFGSFLLQGMAWSSNVWGLWIKWHRKAELVDTKKVSSQQKPLENSQNFLFLHLKICFSYDFTEYVYTHKVHWVQLPTCDK